MQEYEDGICSCGCGQPATEAYDKDTVYKVHKFTCQAGRAKDKIRAADRKKAEDEKQPDGWDDGLHYYVERVDPDDLKEG